MTAPPRPKLEFMCPIDEGPRCQKTLLLVQYIEWLEQQLESCEAARERWEATAEHRQAQLDTLREDRFSLHERVAALEKRLHQAYEDGYDDGHSDNDLHAERYPLEPED